MRMKCLMSKKRRPDMSPESRGEMNHEATEEEREKNKKHFNKYLGSVTVD